MGKEFGDSWPDKWTCYMKSSLREELFFCGSEKVFDFAPESAQTKHT